MPETENIFKILKTTPLPASEIEIEAEIAALKIEMFRSEAIKNLNKRIKIDGFREGHIPEKVLIDRVGELGVLEEAASLALESCYLEILRKAKVNPVGRPTISITKLAAGNPLGFKIKLAVVPEVNLPDYKKIAKDLMAGTEKVEVTDNEFEDTLNQIRKGQAAPNPPQESKNQKTGSEGSSLEEPSVLSSAAEPSLLTDLPELTNEMVKKFGEYKDVADFKIKLRQNMNADKELRNREKCRLKTIEKIIAETKTELPKILIESEKEKMINQFKGNIESMGVKPEDYFKQIGKTEEEVKAEWNEEATKRSKIELILQKIALEEKIEPPKEEVEKETAHILSHQKGADPIRVRIYVEQILTNEKVWQFLEGQK